MNKRMLFIYNPNAGRGIVKNNLADIIETFCENDYDLSVHATLKPKDATRYIARRGQEFDRIVCCGGDGTLNETTDGLMLIEKENRPSCGYIPAGTVNDFAHSFNLPKDMKEAARVAAGGEEFLCDVGELNGDYFDYIAAFGAFTNVSYETPQNFKNALGKLAYFLEGVKQLASIKKYNVKVNVDGEIFEDEVIYGMVTNSFSVGGILNLYDDVTSLDDGLLEALFIKSPKNVIEFQSIITSLLSGDVTNDLFYYRHIDKMTIECDEELSFTVDGEFGGNFKKADFVTHKQAVSFIRGKSNE